MNPPTLPVLTIGSIRDFEPAGSKVEVDVTLFGLGAMTLDSYRFDVNFKPEVLAFSGANPQIVQNIDNVAGTITVARTDVSLALGGTIVKLFFNVVAPGTSALSIPPGSVSLMGKISFTSQDGQVVCG